MKHVQTFWQGVTDVLHGKRATFLVMLLGVLVCSHFQVTQALLLAVVLGVVIGMVQHLWGDERMK